MFALPTFNSVSSVKPAIGAKLPSEVEHDKDKVFLKNGSISKFSVFDVQILKHLNQLTFECCHK